MYCMVFCSSNDVHLMMMCCILKHTVPTHMYIRNVQRTVEAAGYGYECNIRIVFARAAAERRGIRSK